MDKKHLFYQKGFFSNQNEPHTAKLSFSGILKYFCGYYEKKISLRSKKGFSLQNETHQLNYAFFGVLRHFY